MYIYIYICIYKIDITRAYKCVGKRPSIPQTAQALTWERTRFQASQRVSRSLEGWDPLGEVTHDFAVWDFREGHIHKHHLF